MEIISKELIHCILGDNAERVKEIVKELIDQGDFKKLAFENEETLLHHCVFHNAINTFEILLEFDPVKASIDSQTNDIGATPLYIAAVEKRPSIFKYLLRKGANPELPTKEGRIPLHEIAFHNDVVLLTKLLEMKDEETLEQYVNTPDSLNCTPIHCAVIAKNAKKDAISLLLKNKANPRLLDNSDNSAIYYACLYNETMLTHFMPFNDDGYVIFTLYEAKGRTKQITLSQSLPYAFGAARKVRKEKKCVLKPVRTYRDITRLSDPSFENETELNIRHTTHSILTLPVVSRNIRSCVLSTSLKHSKTELFEDLSDGDSKVKAKRFHTTRSFSEKTHGRSRTKLLENGTHSLRISEGRVVDNSSINHSFKSAKHIAEKWEYFLENWSSVSHEKVLKYIYLAIPPNIRSAFWLKSVNGDLYKNKNKDFTELLQFDPRIDTGRVLQQLDKDIKRTMQKSEFFSERFGKAQLLLFHILYGYSHLDTELGYTQGMSDFLAVLSLNISADEETLFWHFCAILNDPKWKLREMFLSGFPCLKRSITIQNKALELYNPSLFKYLKKIGFVCSESTAQLHVSYGMEWYMTLWSRILPLEFLVFVFDLFLFDGIYPTVTIVALSLFDLLSSEIITQTEPDVVMQILKAPQTYLTEITPKKFLSSLNKWKFGKEELMKIIHAIAAEREEKEIELKEE